MAGTNQTDNAKAAFQTAIDWQGDHPAILSLF